VVRGGPDDRPDHELVHLPDGVWAIRRDDRTGFIRAIGVTLVLGIVFLIGQVYDYSTLGFGISDTAVRDDVLHRSPASTAPTSSAAR
jgi:hypothetical protein